MLKAMMSVTMGVLALSATTAASADCAKDSDCKGDRVCESGRCVSASSAPRATPLAPTPPPVAPVSVVVAPSSSPVPSDEGLVLKRHHSTGMMYTGIVLTSLAIVALAAGSTMMAVDQANGGSMATDDNGNPVGGPSSLGWAGIGVVTGSVVLAAIGIPLWVVGARADKFPTSASPFPRPSFAMSSQGGVTSRTAGLAWSF